MEGEFGPSVDTGGGRGLSFVFFFFYFCFLFADEVLVRWFKKWQADE